MESQSYLPWVIVVFMLVASIVTVVGAYVERARHEKRKRERRERRALRQPPQQERRAT